MPLVWWPWWPFNAADVYMGGLLPLERMLREGVIDDQACPSALDKLCFLTS